MRAQVSIKRARITEVQITCSLDAARQLAELVDGSDRKWASSVTVELDAIASSIHKVLRNPTVNLNLTHDGVIAEVDEEG